MNKPDVVFQSADGTAANKDINFEIDEMKLLVPCVSLNDKLYLDIESILSKQPIRHIFNKTEEVCIQSSPKGAKTCILDSLSLVPSWLYLLIQVRYGPLTTTNFASVGSHVSRSFFFSLLQETSRLHGQYDLNSFKFSLVFNSKDSDKTKHFCLNQCFVSPGPQTIEELNVDLTNNSFKDHYYHLYNLLNLDHGKGACSLTFENFLNNYCLLIYDFSATLNQKFT